jgi:hypothetical protein
MKNPLLSVPFLLIGLMVFAIVVKPGQAQDSEPEFDTTILDEETQTMLIELEQQKWGVFTEDSSMSSVWVSTTVSDDIQHSTISVHMPMNCNF